MLRRWKKIGSEAVYENPWWTYRVDRFEIPGSLSGEYHYVHTNGSSMVVPAMNEAKLILVNQYRYLCDRESLEFPCGAVKNKKTHLETAHSELEEETGYRANRMECIGEFNPYNGVTSEICKVYLAHGLQPTVAKPDETEEFELVFCTPEEMEMKISERVIWDGMTLAAWTLARHYVFERSA